MEAKNYAELEIGVDRSETGAYQAELRFMNPSSEAERPPAKDKADLDPAQLAQFELNPQQYGAALAAMLFSSDAVRSEYREVMASVQSMQLPLRVRLRAGPNAPELHGVRWELLCHPDTGAYLFTSDSVLLSRFMTSRDWRTISVRPKSDMAALIAVSSPSNTAEYGLAPVDIDGEIRRAAGNLEGVRVTVAGQDQPLTLTVLLERLREPTDVLYLVCHGGLTDAGPHLYLQAGDGKVAVVKGRELAARIADLPAQPRLAVLASCESAGTETPRGKPGSEAMGALAPMLAEAGIPAILAMRGKISMETVKLMMPVFFRELAQDGQIDRAMAAARSAAVAANRPDFWMPALYSRLRSGRIWFERGFGSGQEFEKWKSIVGHVRDGRFAAILGSGLRERICGDSRSLARGLAERHGFPLAQQHSEDLALVSQYLSVTQDHAYAVNELLRQMREEVLKRHGASIPAEMRDAPLPKLLAYVLENSAEANAADPYRILASMPGSVYISATADSLMAQALKKAGKNPCQLYCNWRRSGDNRPVEPPFDGVESAENPVVYQMLGLFGKNETLVLTENDYFDYMIATAQYQLVPRVVRSALASKSLLFLGFQLTDWSFRVLFRLIQSLEGGSRREKLTNIGVQVNPEAVDVEKAQRYMQQYYDKEANIAIFWGSGEEFLSQLSQQLERAPKDAPAAQAEDEDAWVVG